MNYSFQFISHLIPIRFESKRLGYTYENVGRNYLIVDIIARFTPKNDNLRIFDISSKSYAGRSCHKPPKTIIIIK